MQVLLLRPCLLRPLFVSYSFCSVLVLDVLIYPSYLKGVQCWCFIGASLSLVSETIFRRLWPSRPLPLTTIQLKTYSGELLPVLRTVQVHVSHGSQTANLPLLVVQTDGPMQPSREELA